MAGGRKKKRTLKKRTMKKGRLSKAPPVVRPLPAPRPPPDSAAAKASADLVLKAALIRLERHHKAMDRAMGLESAARTVHSEPAVENPAPPSRVSPATNAKEATLAKPAQTPGAPSIQGPKKKTAADADENEEDAFSTLSGKKRRVRVCWSEAEEAVLLEGVQTHGEGRWKKILIAGRDVFLACRTNVDLKDKWRVMNKRSRASSSKDDSPPNTKKRRVTSTTPPSTPRVAAQRVSPRPNKYSGSYADEEDHALSVDEEAIPKETKVVQLQIATDDTYPSLMTVAVDVRKFDTIVKLRDQLSKKLKSSFRELITIRTRRRPTDQESIESIMESDGDSLYAVLEEARCDV